MFPNAPAQVGFESVVDSRCAYYATIVHSQGINTTKRVPYSRLYAFGWDPPSTKMRLTASMGQGALYGVSSRTLALVLAGSMTSMASHCAVEAIPSAEEGTGNRERFWRTGSSAPMGPRIKNGASHLEPHLNNPHTSSLLRRCSYPAAPNTRSSALLFPTPMLVSSRSEHAILRTYYCALRQRSAASRTKIRSRDPARCAARIGTAPLARERGGVHTYPKFEPILPSIACFCSPSSHPPGHCDAF
ncbi:hypothetical protein DFP72DRAFT_312159 [Ephemerocybe angulata]|uniref:Uncharacterized protein n=1 Tax=Ephemerocybe angulata TaxID=980116 RepID=A0A8H6M4Q3_9AGAR|nr:hypothetical protein DFP72DRAFT_312159 [Tulosesus angulatus]